MLRIYRYDNLLFSPVRRKRNPSGNNHLPAVSLVQGNCRVANREAGKLGFSACWTKAPPNVDIAKSFGFGVSSFAIGPRLPAMQSAYEYAVAAERRQ